MTGTNALASAALVLHALAAVVWVGGMFFAHQVLRPAAAALDPRPRLLLWSRVLGRFFAWVIAAILLLLASGYAMVFAVYSGFGRVGLHVHLMQGIGILMMLLFFHLYFAPWRRFHAAVARQDWGEGARQLGQIRTIVTINLVLGVIVVAIGSGRRPLGRGDPPCRLGRTHTRRRAPARRDRGQKRAPRRRSLPARRATPPAAGEARRASATRRWASRPMPAGKPARPGGYRRRENRGCSG